MNLKSSKLISADRLRREFDRRKQLGLLYKNRMAHLAEVTQPLVLISQVQRSGGTLLSQLFDSHFQCHVHPGELHIGSPNKTHWRSVFPGKTPEQMFDILYETISLRYLREGYSKWSDGNTGKKEFFPFLFLPDLQKRIFLHLCSSPRTEREVLNAYMTSYFNAWLDNRNLYGNKRIIAAFAARLSSDKSSVSQFFSVYPDGWLICVVRDPLSWFVSARQHDPTEYGSLEQAIALWSSSTRSALAARQVYKDRVILIRFEDLVRDTEAVMRKIASRIGIDFDDILLTPTFNGMLIKADSSFHVGRYGVISDPVDRRAMMLNSSDEAYIRDHTEKLLELALNNLDLIQFSAARRESTPPPNHVTTKGSIKSRSLESVGRNSLRIATELRRPKRVSQEIT